MDSREGVRRASIQQLQQQLDQNSPQSQNRYLISQGTSHLDMRAIQSGGNGTKTPTGVSSSPQIKGVLQLGRASNTGTQVIVTAQSEDQLEPHNMPASLQRAPSFEQDHHRSFLDNKVYFIISVSFGLFYFLDVFVGMFMLQREYTFNEGKYFDSRSRQNELLTRPYDIIEIVLLAIFVIEDIIKLAFTSRLTKRGVSYFFNLLMIHFNSSRG
jgi:hypothetical protein